MDDIYTKIFNSYGLKLYGTERTRRGLICRTDFGLKELRKTNSDIETILFEDTIKTHLKGKGFFQTDIYLKTMEDTPYYTDGDVNYVLSNYKDVKEFNLDNEKNILKAIESLAYIHKLTEGLDGNGKNNIDKHLITAQKRRCELNKIKKRIGHQSKYSPLDIIIIKSYGNIVNRTLVAEALMGSNNYIKTVELANKRKNICHNNFKGDSIREYSSGDKLYISGFEKSSFDTSISDIANFIKKQLKDENWDLRLIDKMLDKYNSILTLEDYEIKSLGALILFPSKFYKTFNLCYNKRQVLISDGSLKKLESAIALSDKEEKLLKDLKLL